MAERPGYTFSLMSRLFDRWPPEAMTPLHQLRALHSILERNHNSG